MENNNRQGCRWEVRPVVKWFAEQMEAALKRNDHKTGWLQDDWDELYDRIKDETKELKKECEKLYQDEEKIIKEAADVANFAMMIADKFGEEFGQQQNPESIEPCADREKIKELVEAILIIGARRANNSLQHDSAKELISQHIEGLSERVENLAKGIAK